MLSSVYKDLGSLAPRFIHFRMSRPDLPTMFPRELAIGTLWQALARCPQPRREIWPPLPLWPDGSGCNEPFQTAS